MKRPDFFKMYAEKFMENLFYKLPWMALDVINYKSVFKISEDIHDILSVLDFDDFIRDMVLEKKISLLESTQYVHEWEYDIITNEEIITPVRIAIEENEGKILEMLEKISRDIEQEEKEKDLLKREGA